MGDTEHDLGLIGRAYKNDLSELVHLILFPEKFDVNESTWFHNTPADGGPETLLHFAVRLADTKMVERLMSREDTDVNKLSGSGLSPLQQAIGEKAPMKVLRQLITHWAVDVNRQDKDGSTVLHAAVIDGNLDLVNLLLGHRAIDLNQHDSEGSTPLSLAIECKHKEIVRLLRARQGIFTYDQDFSSHYRQQDSMVPYSYPPNWGAMASTPNVTMIAAGPPPPPAPYGQGPMPALYASPGALLLPPPPPPPPPPAPVPYDRAPAPSIDPRRSNPPVRYFCTHPSCLDSATGQATRSFTRRADLESHEQRAHPPERTFYNCPHRNCSRRGMSGFTRKDHLTEHLRGYHGEDVPKRRQR